MHHWDGLSSVTRMPSQSQGRNSPDWRRGGTLAHTTSFRARLVPMCGILALPPKLGLSFHPRLKESGSKIADGHATTRESSVLSDWSNGWKNSGGPARENLQLASLTCKMKDYYDLHADAKVFEASDAVWLHNPQRKPGHSPKLMHIHDVVYCIWLTPRSKPEVVHCNCMGIYW